MRGDWAEVAWLARRGHPVPCPERSRRGVTGNRHIVKFDSIRSLPGTSPSSGLQPLSPTVGAGLIPARSREGLKPSPTMSGVGAGVQRPDMPMGAPPAYEVLHRGY